MKNKLSIRDLKVKSFVTDLKVGERDTVKGGNTMPAMKQVLNLVLSSAITP